MKTGCSVGTIVLLLLQAMGPVSLGRQELPDVVPLTSSETESDTAGTSRASVRIVGAQVHDNGDGDLRLSSSLGALDDAEQDVGLRSIAQYFQRTPRGDAGEAGQHPPPGTVTLVGVLLTDNGDGDLWADTNETVDMRITVHNRSDVDLTGLRARLSSSDPRIGCIAESAITIGDLGVGMTVTSAEAFRFLVADVERASVDQDFAALFFIDLESDSFAGQPEQFEVLLDLDLDATGGGTPTVFFEGFENGFGSFEPMHLDETLNPPPTDLFNDDAGLANSDGYRCQYHDPDWERSNQPGISVCYLNPPGLPDAFYFHVTDDRASSGSQAMHWGIYLDGSLEFTTPFAQLEAIRTSAPIDLGWQDVCSNSRTVICSSDLDCPVDESCAPPSPTLSLRHQISQMDHRQLSGALGGVDRAVVFAQAAGMEGEPIGDWIKLRPYRNVYDTRDTSAFFECKFDPIDDGNDEDDFFDPTDPNRRLGPSSTCYPERTFVHQGDTEGPFDPANIGDASDGPGLEGSSGSGTWVEPRFDLSRFVGRRIRLRFLETTLWFNAPHWTAVIPSIGELDDGWFIDDVTVTDTLSAPAVVAVDPKENDGIKSDDDLDGRGAVCDCAPGDGSAWTLPGVVEHLTLAKVDGVDGTWLDWIAPSDPGGTSAAYDVIRTGAVTGFDAGGTCLVQIDPSITTAADAAIPSIGDVFFYLVRARHACGAGPVQDGSVGPRAVGPC